MSVTVGPRREQAPLTAADLRELEILLNLSRRKREALGACLRRHKVPMDPRIREQLVSMDRNLDDWYEVALVDCDELYEVKGKEGAKEQDNPEPQKQQREEVAPVPDPAPATPAARGRDGKQGQGRQVVRGRGGRAQGQSFVIPPPPVQPFAVPGGSRVRVKRGAAEEANRTLDESFDRGEIVEQQEKKSKKRKQHQHQMQVKKATKKRKLRSGKMKKKKKLMRSRTVKGRYAGIYTVHVFRCFFVKWSVGVVLLFF